MMLRRAPHDQQRAMCEDERVLNPPTALAPQIEAPLSAQAQRSDSGAVAQLGLIVTVPAHGVASDALTVEQHNVEAMPGPVMQRVTDCGQTNIGKITDGE